MVSLLAGEAERWKVSAAKLGDDLKSLIGNILLASASVAYNGPFTSVYRNNLVKDWKNKCKDLDIPVSEDYLLERILSE